MEILKRLCRQVYRRTEYKVIYFSHNKQEYYPFKKGDATMDVKQDQAVKRLLKKLSALRATLKNDERKLLDQLVTGPADEVEAHSLSPKSPFAAAKAAKAAKDANEVEAHSLSPKSPFAAAKAAKAARDANEVEAHSLSPKSPFAAAKAAKAAKDANEVEAHSLSPKSPFAAAKAAKAAKDANEVEAHSMEIGLPKLEGFHIVLDPNKEEYHID